MTKEKDLEFKGGQMDQNMKEILGKGKNLEKVFILRVIKALILVSINNIILNRIKIISSITILYINNIITHLNLK